MIRPSRLGGALLLAGAIALAGCAGPQLPPPPNLLARVDSSGITPTEPERQSPEVELLFATDRMPSDTRSEKTRYYDWRRSDSLAVGSVTVRFGEDLSWEDVLARSLDPKSKRVPLEITGVEELVRFPGTAPAPVFDGRGGITDPPEVLEAARVARDELQDELRRRLAASERKDVFIYIHGVGNSFSDPMYRMAQLWHFLGRPGVPIVYTWPSIKGGGPLKGYTYARESSEFTVYHLRQFIRAVAATPEVERIHILAHSRGTGITLAVLRDIRLIYHDDPERALREVKLGRVIVAAPDIDLKVAQQLFRPDWVLRILERMTIYATENDSALDIAEFLFNSGARVGGASVENLSPELIEAFNEGRMGFDLVLVEATPLGAHGHTYWIDNPEVLSDVILVLRDEREAGREHGRPLVRSPAGVWQIFDGYPDEGPHAERAD